jgi:Zn finger protein HypA/HybF involved in hydrogenase expression
MAEKFIIKYCPNCRQNIETSVKHKFCPECSTKMQYLPNTQSKYLKNKVEKVKKEITFNPL